MRFSKASGYRAPSTVIFEAASSASCPLEATSSGSAGPPTSSPSQEALNLLASWSATPRQVSTAEAPDEALTRTPRQRLSHHHQGDTVELQEASAKGPAEWFTGDVWIDAIVQGEEPSRVRVSAVHFPPGARIAWHSRALGQALYVTEGKGLVQSRGEDIVTIRSGDVLHAPANEWHWHGAATDRFMTHLSITEGVPAGQGPETNWAEHVTDAQYRGEDSAKGC